MGLVSGDREGDGEKLQRGMEKFQRRGGGQPDRSPVLAQRAVADSPRWTRAVGDRFRPPSLRETWCLALGGGEERASLEGAFISGERRPHGPLLPERAPSEGPRSTGAVGPTRVPFTCRETS